MDDGSIPPDGGHHLQPNLDSPISVTIRAEPHQHEETDEEVLHKHHEQFDKLITLLSTDVGDSSLRSLCTTVRDWEQDTSRILLTVETGAGKWVLQKHIAESPNACSLCRARRTRSGLVLDKKLETISKAEADLLANYLTLAFRQTAQETTPEQASQLEEIRDNPVDGPSAPTSLRDDVSVSVRTDKPKLAHDIAKIRQRDAEQQVSEMTPQSGVIAARMNGVSPRAGIRRRPSDDQSVQVGKPKAHRMSEASDATVKPIEAPKEYFAAQSSTSKDSPALQTPQEQASTPDKKVPIPNIKPPVSILFLSTSHIRKIIAPTEK